MTKSTILSLEIMININNINMDPLVAYTHKAVHIEHNLSSWMLGANKFGITFKPTSNTRFPMFE